jgi:hypothetical protein
MLIERVLQKRVREVIVALGASIPCAPRRVCDVEEVLREHR